MRTYRWIAVALGLAATLTADTFQSRFPEGVTRPWAGADYWTNPLEDWQLSGGRLANLESGGDRNVAILTAELTDRRAPFTARVTLDQLSARLRGDGFVGFKLGLQGRFGDYRDSAIYGRGFCAGIDARGRLFIGASAAEAAAVPAPFRDLTLELAARPTGSRYALTLTCRAANGSELARLSRSDVHGSWLVGLMALAVSHRPAPALDLTQPRPPFDDLPEIGQARGGDWRFAFSKLRLAGGKVRRQPGRAFGPIWWAQHTLDNTGTLKCLALFAPVDFPGATAQLVLDGKLVATAAIDGASRSALFKVNGLDVTRPHDYVIRFRDVTGRRSRYAGRLRAIPRGRPLVIAALSCNDSTGFPHNELVRKVAAHRPDVLAFLGDQIYENIGGYGLVRGEGDRPVLSYLRKYAMHGWTWRDLLRELPAIVIPDDHDVFHGNLWGCGGKRADLSAAPGYEQQDSGGYKQPPAFVNVVHRTQAGSLPDPFDPTPCLNGISVYYTQWRYGPLDFAVIADRQFKSAPKPLLPEGRVINGWPQNPDWDPKTQADVPEAHLLGDRQLQFLEHWAAHRPAEARFRLVVSQTVWAGLHTLPKAATNDEIVPRLPVRKAGEYPPDDEPKPDFDTNGWPPRERAQALRLLNQAGTTLHVAGDQHLGTTGQYGLETWNDGPWWIVTPATANLWPRRWFPAQGGRNRKPGAPRYTGEFEDAFGNKLTVHAVANPVDVDREPARLFDRAVGYAVITCDPATGLIQLANWPYWAAPDLSPPDDRPFPGWPITLRAK